MKPWWLIASLSCALSLGCSPERTTSSAQVHPTDRLPVDGLSPSPLRFGSTALLGSTADRRAAPLVNYLAKKHRIPTTVVAAADYSDLLRLFRDKKLDMVMLSAMNCVKLSKKPPPITIATSTRKGSPTYLGYLVTLKEAKLNTIDSLENKRIAWVSPNSTSGYLFPRALLRHFNHDPDTFFAPNPRFGKTHRATLELLVNGEVDVAATAGSFVDPGPQRLVPDDVETTVVAKTARIPFDCVVLRPELQRDLGRKISDALLALNADHATREKLANTLGINGFVPYDADRYRDVEKLLETKTSKPTPSK